MRKLLGIVVMLACAWGIGATPDALAQEARVRVDRFTVTGNTLLPTETLVAALARFKGELTLAELRQAASVVQALYRQAGYGSVVAYVPPQKGEPGHATIAVLEGRVARVYIAGNRRFSDASIRRAVPQLREGETPQLRRIDAQIQLANENPSRQISLALESGPLPGEVEARITVSELPASRWSLALDNTGNPSTGRLRSSLGYQNAALWSLDHQLSMQLQLAPERPRAVTVFSAGYRITFYDAGLALDLFGAYSDVDGGTAATPAGPLQFSGQGKMVGLRLTRPFERRGDFNQRVALGLDRRAYLNDCSIQGLPPGACGSAGGSVTVHPVSIDYQLQSAGRRPFGFNIGYSRNLDIGGSNARAADYEFVRPGARLRYDLVRLGAHSVVPLPGSWQLQARASGQWTAGALVPGEQLGIGGANAVRGYEEREITGDSGAWATFEVMTPTLLRTSDGAGAMLRLLGFVDAGRVYNRLDTPCLGDQARCTLASVGIGARLEYGSLQVKLDVARVLRDALRTRSGDTRVHLQALYGWP